MSKQQTIDTGGDRLAFMDWWENSFHDFFYRRWLIALLIGAFGILGLIGSIIILFLYLKKYGGVASFWLIISMFLTLFISFPIVRVRDWLYEESSVDVDF